MTRENKNKTIAIIVTVVIHVVAVVLLIYMALVTPLPLPGEAGVEVNLGMYNEGKGFQQQPKPKKVESAPVPETPPVKDRTVTQDTEETPAIEEVKPKKETPKVDERALFKMSNKPEESSSEGETDNIGDQGSEHGSKDADSYTGLGGSGGGVSYDLGGRGNKSLIEPDKNKIIEEGTVTIKIKVDREGRVIDAHVQYKGTNITDKRMYELARQAALKSVFNPDKNAPEEQFGTITYFFTLTAE